MKKIYLLLLQFVLIISITPAQIRILFDATKAETAANADWVIDDGVYNIGYPTSNGNGGAPKIGAGNESNPSQYPANPVVLGQTYPENHWTGSLSYWGLDCVKKGYAVETLPIGASITFGNIANAQDLSHYKAFVICEPNIRFTAAEKTAILDFVHNGGGLFMISDHDVSDRNNDGWDSPMIWNDLMQVNSTGNTNPFGLIFNNSGNTAIDNFSQTSSNYNRSLSATDPLLHGTMGDVAKIKWTNGTSMTINPTANPSVTPVFYTNAIAAPPTGNNQVMVAYALYGSGKVVAIGDSSPCDDGTGDPNDNLFNGYMGDVPPNHRNLLMNGTIWLVTPSGGPLPLTLTQFSAQEQQQAVLLSWQTENEWDLSGYTVQRSADGIHFENTGSMITAANTATKMEYQYEDRSPLLSDGDSYYRLKMANKDGSFMYSAVRHIRFSNHFMISSLINNPVQNEARLNINSTSTTSLDCRITSMSGQQISAGKINITRGAQLFSINTNSLSAGVYLLTLRNDYYTNTIRFVK